MVLMQELVVSSLAQADALAKLLVEKGIIIEAEFMNKLSAEIWDKQGKIKRTGRGKYQKLH